MKLEINIQTQLKPEFEYVCEFIFKEFFGLDYKLNIDQTTKTEISLPNQKKLLFRNEFFLSHTSADQYLKANQIPEKIDSLNSKYNVDIDLPLIYGKSNIDESENIISCDFDIFGSIFFMLSRWEESVSSKRDAHNRFPVEESLAFKNNFLHRPIVNEYLELLWNLLIELDPSLKRKDRSFEIVPSHDIDELFFLTPLNIIKYPLKLMKGLRQNSDYKFIEMLKLIFQKKDIYFQQLEFFIQKNKEKAYKGLFFFIAGGNSKFENFYKIRNKKLSSVFNNIQVTGQKIGIHPSYYSSENKGLIDLEVETMNELLKMKVEYSRQHFLRFDTPETFISLANNNIKLDSSYYYTNTPGFRCGICDPFPLFDVMNRKKTGLKEIPLTVMDCSYEGKSKEEILESLHYFKNTISKYKGKYVFLWHNSITYWKRWYNVQESFKEVFYK